MEVALDRLLHEALVGGLAAEGIGLERGRPGHDAVKCLVRLGHGIRAALPLGTRLVTGGEHLQRDADGLLEIPGVGEKRRRLLLETFGSVAGISLASREEIASLRGFSVELAERILTNLKR